MLLKLKLSSCLIVMLLIIVGNLNAQERVVSDDEVNKVAEKLYCPVCENIPLDSCGTAACQDWRNEIRLQLEAGATESEIINDFVQRFGERVVGTPRDPSLRFLSVAPPLILSILGIFVAVFILVHLRNRHLVPNTVNDATLPESDVPADHFQDLLKRDLSQ